MTTAIEISEAVLERAWEQSEAANQGCSERGRSPASRPRIDTAEVQVRNTLLSKVLGRCVPTALFLTLCGVPFLASAQYHIPDYTDVPGLITAGMLNQLTLHQGSQSDDVQRPTGNTPRAESTRATAAGSASTIVLMSGAPSFPTKLAASYPKADRLKAQQLPGVLRNPGERHTDRVRRRHLPARRRADRQAQRARRAPSAGAALPRDLAGGWCCGARGLNAAGLRVRQQKRHMRICLGGRSRQKPR
jgi:hypothetical protein